MPRASTPSTWLGGRALAGAASRRGRPPPPRLPRTLPPLLPLIGGCFLSGKGSFATAAADNNNYDDGG